MKVLFSFVAIVAFSQVVSAQGVRMSADFLPLAVGNRWVYEVTNEDGRKIGDLDFSIQEHTIISGRSFYVMTRFPFVAEAGAVVRLVRYDRQERQYLRMFEDEEGPLFLADGSSSEVLESDTSGLPMKFVLHTDLMALTFQRGVGIVEARIRGGNGLQAIKLTSARIGQGRPTETSSSSVGTPAAANPAGIPQAPPPKPPDQKTKDLVENVTTITEENPMLEVQATADRDGYKFVLTVTNTSDKLLPFKFGSGQNYDFAVIDPSTGQEIWRWSRRMVYFTAVTRSEALRPGRQWKYEVSWNRRDNDLNEVPSGDYRLIGIVSSEPPLESDPITFEVK